MAEDNEIFADLDSIYSDLDSIYKAPEEPKTAGEALSKNLSETAGSVAETGADLGTGLGGAIADTSRGVVQGGTLGFSDEIYGGLSATAQAIGDLDTTKWLENYRAAQKSSEAANDEAKERSPWLYGGGELFGGLAAGAATAGAGLAAAGTKLGLREASKQGGKALAKEAAKIAAAGGTAGAIQGVGISKGNIDTDTGIEKLKSDAIGGGVLGAGLGLGMAGAGTYLGPKLSKMASKAKNWADEFVEESPLATQMIKGYKKGKKGKIINQSKAYDRLQSRQYLKDLKDETSGILSADELLGKEQGDILTAASGRGDKVNVLDAAKEASKELKSLLGSPAIGDKPAVSGTQEFLKAMPGTNQFIDELQRFTQGELSPDAAWELRNQVIKLAKNKNLPFGTKEILNKLQASIKDSLDEAVPDFANASAITRKFKAAVIDPLTGKGMPIEDGGYLGSLTPAQKKERVAGSLAGILQQSRTPGQAGKVPKDKLTQVIDNLTALEKEYQPKEGGPGLMEKLGLGSVDEFERKIFDKADDSAMTRQVLGYDPQSSPTTNLWSLATLGGATTGRGVLIAGANQAGRASQTVVPTLAKISKAIYSAPEQSLYGVANGLKGSGFDHLGNALEKALNEKNTYLKNAALFSILQNPKARAFISADDIGSEPDGEVE